MKSDVLIVQCYFVMGYGMRGKLHVHHLGCPCVPSAMKNSFESRTEIENTTENCYGDLLSLSITINHSCVLYGRNAIRGVQESYPVPLRLPLDWSRVFMAITLTSYYEQKELRVLLGFFAPVLLWTSKAVKQLLHFTKGKRELQEKPIPSIL